MGSHVEVLMSPHVTLILERLPPTGRLTGAPPSGTEKTSVIVAVVSVAPDTLELNSISELKLKLNDARTTRANSRGFFAIFM